MPEEVDIRITPSLHPGNVRALNDYDADTAPYLGQVETAFSEAYIGLGQVHTAREKARTNPGWNEAQQVLATQDFADKVFSRIAARFDLAGAALSKSIAAFEEQLSAPITSKASHAVSAEIRAHVKGMDPTKRIGFIQQATAVGDETTVSAVLGAPGYLSGFDDPKTVEVMTRLYHERNSPAVAKRLRSMKAARDLIDERSGLVFPQMERAVGMAPHRVQALRQAKDAAEQAFILRDA